MICNTNTYLRKVSIHKVLQVLTIILFLTNPEIIKAKNAIDTKVTNFSDSLRFAIMLCTELPHSAKPQKVFYKGQTGHVFVRLLKLDFNDDIIESIEWGFYPEKPIQSVFFRKTKSKLHSNKGKNYHAAITCKISAVQFEQALNKALELSKNAYDLNRNNCYHYGIQLFNSVSNNIQIPQRDIKFPFLIGKGGSPCALFADLIDISKMPLSGDYVVDFPKN